MSATTTVSKEWEAVCELIEEVEQEQKRQQFARSLVEWQLAVRQFRKVELQRIVLQEPEEADLSCHAACLHSLLAMGEALAVWARDCGAAQWAALNTNPAEIEASVEALQQSLRERHHGFSSEELRKAREKIFGGAP